MHTMKMWGVDMLWFYSCFRWRCAVNFVPCCLTREEWAPSTHRIGGFVAFSHSECFWEERIHLPLLGIKPPFLCCPVCNLGTVLTELSWLLGSSYAYHYKNNFNILLAMNLLKFRNWQQFFSMHSYGTTVYWCVLKFCF